MLSIPQATGPIPKWLSLCLLSIFSLVLLVRPSVAATAADYFIHSLPGAPEGPLLKMHAGHIEITPEHNGHLFFWLYHNRHIANRQRTVIWLNGGPGCSSLDGALMELGPYRVGEGGVLSYNEGSWDEFANVLFVDQPVGTGFSYANSDSYVHELQEGADQFVTFMEKFFQLFPEFEHDDLYFAGESYAGQYLPYIAKTILDRNRNSEENKRWNLQGVMIGNGWISPAEQYSSYLPFAYAEGLVQGGTPEAKQVESQVSQCMAELSKPGSLDKVDIYVCEAILTRILAVSKVEEKCVNMYDIRLTDSYPSCGMAWPTDLKTVTPYLRRDDVKKALHINPDKRTGWTECSGSVSSAFRAVTSKPSVQLLPGLLEAGIPIVLFSGAKDMICNHIGTEDLISNMKWGGGTGFEISPGVWAPKRAWTFEGEAAGFYQEARNLTYVLFYNSSHMVPYDHPKRTRDMLDRFMGVDYATISDKPVNSHVEGDSVIGHTNSTSATADEKKKLHEATLKAYYRSGETALVVVLIAAAVFGIWFWRSRRHQSQSYMSLPMMGSGNKGHDVEAGDYNDSELHDLSRDGVAKPKGGPNGNVDDEHYTFASDSDEEESDHGKKDTYRDNAGGK